MAEPKLPNLKGTKKETKGYIKGVQDGTRNDLSKPYGGLKKAKVSPRNKKVPPVNV